MKTVIDCRCPVCGRISLVTCEYTALCVYRNGALAQDVFPNLDAHTRETIISGTCIPCQLTLFANNEDEDEDEDYCNGECDTCTEFDCPENAFAPVSRED